MEQWLSLWSAGPTITEKDFVRIREEGFLGVEVWAEHKRAKEYLRLAKQNGFKVGMHLPFHDLNLATPEPNVWDRVMIILSEWLIQLGDQGAEHAVLHGGYAWASEDRLEALEMVKERLHLLGEKAKQAGVQLLLENLAPDKLNYTHIVASTLKEWNDLLFECQVGACLDIGHLYIMGEDPVTTVQVLGNRLKSVHYSDNDTVADLHLLPGDGSDITSGLVDLLVTNGFNGALVYEINPYRYSLGEILEKVRKAQLTQQALS
jgi:sugar phosphate isomerase/epimerase